ncbi:MAG: GldG family protein [Clostridia bacterium]|nr:GldG family protein [Clostridia bacterium]
MAQHASRKALRHGSVSVALTILVAASVILLNGIVTRLAMRYGWFVNMNPTLLYPVTDTCYGYLDEYVMDKVSDDTPIRLIFCDEQSGIESDATQRFILNTARELEEHYPGKVTVEFLNIWERPSVARSYGVTASTSVVVACGEESRVCTLRDFFVFSIDDSSTPLAYNGEKRLTVAMKAVVTPDLPVAYFTLNHGEAMTDYSLMYAATDAGYMVNYLDSLSFDIPDDCGLLVSCNPSQDFTDIDSVSGYSEVDKIRSYLADGGRFMLFVSADTFAAGSFPNLEGLLTEWGVGIDHKKGSEGVEECFSIRDTAHSLTVDGYTLLGKLPETGRAAEITAPVTGSIRLGNATGISVAEGFARQADGTSFTGGSRTLYTLLRSHPGAQAWAGGRAVARTDEGFNLMTLTMDADTNGSLLVCSSVDYASEEAMQSGVYDNETLLLSALAAMGKDDTPLNLTSQPFSDDSIRILTTAEARTITICLTVIPAVLAAVLGLVILIRRKNA